MASPFARSLLFGWIAVYMYEGDAPLAERRAAALALDRELLRDLLGGEELRSLLDGDVVAQVELELQRLTPERAARDADEVHDLLRVLGPLDHLELSARVADGSGDALDGWLAHLLERRRVVEVGMGGSGAGPVRRFAAAEDAARLRDALGVAVPVGLPAAFTDPVDTPLRDLVERFARTHAPFTTGQLAGRLGLSGEVVRAVLGELVRDGKVVEGEFSPAGTEREWCRRGGAPPAPPSFVGGAAQGDRPGGRFGPGPVPAGVAGRGRPSAGGGRAGRGGGCAAGSPVAGVPAGGGHPGGPGGGLPPRGPGRAVQHG